MTVITNSIPVDYDGSRKEEISAGILVINTHEGDFTETMKRYLSAIIFRFYNKLDNDEYIEIEGTSIKWDSKEDIAYMLTAHHTPKDTILGYEIILDKSIFDLKDRRGNPLYPDAKDIVEFPIEIVVI